jgi:hypothetical protein
VPQLGKTFIAYMKRNGCTVNIDRIVEEIIVVQLKNSRKVNIQTGHARVAA